MQAWYGNVAGPVHGSFHQLESATILLQDGELITYAEVGSNGEINHLRSKTNYGRTFGPYEASNTAKLVLPFKEFNMTYGMVALAGASGSKVDSLKFYFYNN